jgi:hypothetical protein
MLLPPQVLFDLGDAQSLATEVENLRTASVTLGGGSGARPLGEEEAGQVGVLAKSLTRERTESAWREKRAAICWAVSWS